MEPVRCCARVLCQNSLAFIAFTQPSAPWTLPKSCSCCTGREDRYRPYRMAQRPLPKAQHLRRPRGMLTSASKPRCQSARQHALAAYPRDTCVEGLPSLLAWCEDPEAYTLDHDNVRVQGWCDPRSAGVTEAACLRSGPSNLGAQGLGSGSGLWTWGLGFGVRGLGFGGTGHTSGAGSQLTPRGPGGLGGGGCRSCSCGWPRAGPRGPHWGWGGWQGSFHGLGPPPRARGLRCTLGRILACSLGCILAAARLGAPQRIQGRCWACSLG